MKKIYNLIIKFLNNDSRKKIAIGKKQFAFTLIELMLSMVILIIILLSLFYTYIACFEVNELSRNLTLANNALQAQIESIRETAFTNLSSLDGTTFTLDGFASGRAIGVRDIYDSAYSDLKYIRLVACWRQKSGRLIGEDSNLNGAEDPGEGDGDGIVESPAEIVTLVSEIE